MKYLDYACAWTLFVTAVVWIAIIGFWHPPGQFLDAPEIWVLVAMMNFLRLANGYSAVRGLRTYCLSANLFALTTEVLRFGLFANWMVKTWGSYYLLHSLTGRIPYFIAALCALVETVFSLQKNDSRESARA